MTADFEIDPENQRDPLDWDEEDEKPEEEAEEDETSDE